jgi:hypothetical protein
MVRKFVEQVSDDLDGAILDAETGETVPFAIDGRAYEIDLSADHAAALRQALTPYVTSARPTDVGRARRRGASRQRGGYALSVIRVWAQENGHEVPARGRVRNTVIDAYNAAH